MNTIHLIGTAMGIGLAAGIRLYATVLALGMALRMGWFELRPELANLQVLADWRVLAVAGFGFLMEFFADKVPWVDSLWDGIHTVVRPLGAAILGATALGTAEPATQIMLALLAGGVAFTGHSAKAATRLAVNHSPEPVSNIALSLAGDMLVPVGAWAAIEHPYVMLTIAGIFLVLFFWLSPKVFRVIRLELSAVKALAGSWFQPAEQPEALPAPYTASVFSSAAPALGVRLERAQDPHVQHFLRHARREQASPAIRCIAGRDVKGMSNSIGYLFLDCEALVFVARRALRYRAVSVPLASITGCRLRRGILLDRIQIEAGRRFTFHLFKAAEAAGDVPLTAATAPRTGSAES